MIEWLRAAAPHTPTRELEELVAPLHIVFEDCELTRPERIAMFLAQVSHESGGFRYRKENLNYSEEALNRVFGKYFTTIEARKFARKPEAIANRVYASRMGNGDTASGDGWRFRGRGLIQLTGRNNYTAYARDKGMTLDEAIEYLTTTEGACDVAGWYWSKNHLNDYVPNVREVTRRINGGYNGLAHREKLYEDVLAAVNDRGR